jgi:membrane-anchored protein YejM (alkaline phosphatase superfamily)
MKIIAGILTAVVIGINMYFIVVYIQEFPNHWAIYLAFTVLLLFYLNNTELSSHSACMFAWWCLTPLSGVSTILQLYRESDLLVEETGVPGENHRPVASDWQTLSHNVVHLALMEIRTRKWTKNIDNHKSVLSYLVYIRNVIFTVLDALYHGDQV